LRIHHTHKYCLIFANFQDKHLYVSSNKRFSRANFRCLYCSPTILSFFTKLHSFVFKFQICMHIHAYILYMCDCLCIIYIYIYIFFYKVYCLLGSEVPMLQKLSLNIFFQVLQLEYQKEEQVILKWIKEILYKFI
jgi:hypothetical protein